MTLKDFGLLFQEELLIELYFENNKIIISFV